MIHYQNSCNFKISHEITDICKQCSLFDHHDFIRSFKFDEPVKNPIHHPILEALRGGKKWRVQSKPNSECGHPGVRNTQGKCVFCLVKTERGKVSGIDDEITRVKEHLKLLETCKLYGVTSVPIMPGARQAAIQSGHKWYWSDKACNHCGSTDRMVYVANGRCAECGKR